MALMQKSSVFAAPIYSQVYLTFSGDSYVVTDSYVELYTRNGDDNIIGAGIGGITYLGSGNDTFRGYHNVGVSSGQVAYGGAGNDTLEGSYADDRFYGGTEDDILIGDYGDDVLDGGLGADIMAGGWGSDTYYFDDIGDRIYEEGEGTDTVYTKITMSIANFYGVENVILSGGALWVEGNAIANMIKGNSLDNRLWGLAGNDTLFGNGGGDELYGGEGDDILRGGGGHDMLYGDSGDDWLRGDAESDLLDGGDGNDLLQGGLGNDQMSGGAGDDVYYVDAGGSPNRYGDSVIEAANAGIDTVYSMVDLYLYENVENGVLMGSVGTGYGNELDNTITGNAVANELWGGDGNDHLIGGDGDDALLGGAGNDILDGGYGSDFFEIEGQDTIIDAGGSGDVARIFTDTYVLATEGIEWIDFYGSLLIATASSEWISCEAGVYVDCGGGDDHFTGLARNISGGNGNDIVELSDGGYSTAAVSADLGGGDDTFWGQFSTAASIEILCGDGNDYVDMVQNSSASINVQGGDGDDWFDVAVNGSVYLDGGAGFDRFNLAYLSDGATCNIYGFDGSEDTLFMGNAFFTEDDRSVFSGAAGSARIASSDNYNCVIEIDLDGDMTADASLVMTDFVNFNPWFWWG